jgi:putative copper export protein
VGAPRFGKVWVVIIGALVIAVVIVFALPIAFLLSGTLGAVTMGWLLTENAEATHPGSELVETNY